MPPVAGHQVVGGCGLRTLQDAVVGMVAFDHFRKPWGFNGGGGIPQSP